MKPFLKWVGGKSRLIPKYEELGIIPDNFNNYYEPFLGGGAMYFYLSGKGKIKGAILSDLNSELINCYQQLKTNYLEVSLYVRAYQIQHRLYPDGSFFREVRKQSFLNKDKSVQAARFIYLNKACHSGIYRVNQSGEFNTSIGGINQKIYQPDLLEISNRELNKSQNLIIARNGLDILQLPQENDFAFIDSPYHETYDEYTSDKFREEKQEKLRDICKVLIDKRVKVLISNSDTEYIRNLYSEKKYFKIHQVKRSGSFNSDPKKRNKVNELIIQGVCSHE